MFKGISYGLGFRVRGSGFRVYGVYGVGEAAHWKLRPAEAPRDP